MFCQKCGSEIEQGNEFCTVCGTKKRNSPAAEKATMPKRKKKILWMIIAIVVAVSLLAGYFAYSSKRIKLKYSWGTGIQTIIADGGISSSDQKTVWMEDGVDVDRIAGSLNVSSVHYHFEENELYEISYLFHMPGGTEDEEVIEIVSEYYGDHYFQPFGPSAGLDGPVFWWKNGTVVCLKGIGVSYYDEEYFMDEYRHDYEIIREFFGK